MNFIICGELLIIYGFIDIFLCFFVLWDLNAATTLLPKGFTFFHHALSSPIKAFPYM